MVTKNNTPYESIEQETFVTEFEKTFPDVLIHSVPNGGHRHKAVAEKIRREGQKKGIPDLFIPAWRLWIEMKRQKGGILSKEQKEIIAYLESVGYSVIVGYGWKNAMEKVLEYHQKRSPG